MTILHTKKKLYTLLIVLIFTLNLVFSTNIVADFDETLKSQGVWFDDFDDTDGIENMVNCVHKGNYIELEQGKPTYEYNFFNDSDTAEIWTHDMIWLDDGLLSKLSQFVSPNLLLGDEIEDYEEKSKVGTLDDGKSLYTESYVDKNDISANPIHHFRFELEQESDQIENVVIEWWFGNYLDDANLKELTMYVWGYGDLIPRWESFAETTIEYNENNIKNGTSADITFPPFGNDEYISEEGCIDILIVGFPNKTGHSKLFTDFIKTTVTTTYGFMSSGYIISDPIEPSDFGGWENVLWTSSKYSEKSGVEIQVLNADKTVISGFNSTSSPLDISDIEKSEIRLKAILHSSSPTVTPKLLDWGVILQSKDGFYDDFSTSYRIGKTEGIKQENGFINVSEFYNDWEFFGKNSANTRTYSGATITDEPTSFTWYSDDKVGGGFRTPVTSNGKVYVASADKKVYAFNETADSTDPANFSQQSIDVSSELEFDIDACIAVAEDYLIVGSSEFGKQNKLYALNKNDLSEEKWNYSDGKICFSAPPTIHDGVLYISTLGGNLWNLPSLSKLGSYLGSNNKLLAINIDNGDIFWENKLPAASISTPTVEDDLVFIGCQNMFGSSLLAYDIDDGSETWNQSVGIIGRSAPVYADDKIFVSANEKESVSDKGENKIIALDALNGEILWNKSIGEMDAFQLLQLLKGRSFFYKLIEGFAPITTPAYYKDTLYFVSPNGTLFAVYKNGSDIWSYDLTTNIFGIPSFYTCSPLIVDDILYIVTGDAMVYAIDIDSSIIVEPLWDYQIEEPEKIFPPPQINVMASPVLANGLLIFSLTEYTYDLSGKLYTVGEYTPNSQGTVTSTAIHVPSGYWWSNFSADNTTTENNTIKYSILNQNNSVLKDNLNGAPVSISDINSGAIKIHALLNVGNSAETMPSIDSWQLSWTPETEPPVFIEDSFEPGEDGWVNLNLEECSIEVQDVEDESHDDLLSGLDISTAKFRLGYVPKDTDTAKYSDWYTATSDSDSGVKKARITANIQDVDLSMKKLLNITFSIKDLAGNSATSNTTEFRTDTVKPSSNITNIDEILDEYNDVFVISADAEDNAEFTGDPNVSGISKVALEYQYKNSSDEEWSEWTTFSQKSMPASWYFGKDESTDEALPSGYYRLITIATDKAGNSESLDVSKATDEFLFDVTPPEMLTEFDDEYTLATLPEFDLSISDDFELYGLYYKLDSATNFVSVELGINQETYETEWTMPETDWTEILDGESHEISFKIIDSVGNEFITTTTITRDNEISNIYVDLSDFSDWNWDDKFTITAQIAEDITVDQAQLFYSYSEDNQTWTEYKQAGDILDDSPFSWEFTATNGSGHYKFYTKIIDTSGVVYTSSAETINLTLIPTHHVILVIFLGILLILATVYVIRKTRKEKQE